MRAALSLAAVCSLVVAACQPSSVKTTLPPMANEDAPLDLSAGDCRAEPGQRFVGHTATAELGASALRATGATTLRWAPPNAALTMDYRMDRLTVAYGADMLVTRLGCG